MKGIWKFSQLFWKPEIISLKETTKVKEKEVDQKKKKKPYSREPRSPTQSPSQKLDKSYREAV